MNSMRRISGRSWVALVVLLATLLAAPAAHAWWRGGFGFGFGPVFVGPPFYVVPPPAYYWPPPVSYAPGYPPPAGYAPGYPPGDAPGNAPGATPLAPHAAPGQACYAGPYVCPLVKPVPPGGACSCPTNENGRIGGHVG